MRFKMKLSQINPMNTLDKLGSRELLELMEIVHAYANAGSFAIYPATGKGKRYAFLPESWQDEGVYADFNADSGMVFLTNSDYQALVDTDFGLMMWYITPYNGFEGTLFDLAEQAINDLTGKEGKPINASKSNWHIGDLNALYGYLADDIEALQFTDADVTDFYKAKDSIIYALIADKINGVFSNFKQNHGDYLAQLQNMLPDGSLAEQFINDCLIDLEREVTDSDDWNKYAEHIKQAMLNLAN